MKNKTGSSKLPHDQETANVAKSKEEGHEDDKA